MSSKTNLNTEELKMFLNYIITNNRHLQEQGKVPVTVAVEGEAGIGKTSTILQVAQENGLKCIRLNLATMEELADLIGFPVRQFQLCKVNSTPTIKPTKPAVKKKAKAPVVQVSVTEPVYPEAPTLPEITPVIKLTTVLKAVTSKKQVLENGKFVIKEVETSVPVEEEVIDEEATNLLIQQREAELAILMEEHNNVVQSMKATYDEQVKLAQNTAADDEADEIKIDQILSDNSDMYSDCMWVDEQAVDQYIKRGYEFTGEKRMTYCPPEWIANVDSGVILLLDDYTRCDPRFAQATMTLIETQSYMSWSLPKDSHIILSTNPDNGNYHVTSLDDAQKTRFITTNLKFDIDTWAKWAEANSIDGRCINFLLLHPELVTDKINPRAITMFFNSISSIKEFEKELPLIQMIGESCVGGEFTTMFSMFINNKLDKLVSPKDMLLHDNQAYITGELKNCIGTDNDYRADIASTLTTRLINFSVSYSEKNTITQKTVDRLIHFVTHPDIFNDDLKYVIVKRLLEGNKKKFEKIMLNDQVIKISIK